MIMNIEDLKSDILKKISLPTLTIWCDRCNLLWGEEGLYGEHRLPREIICKNCNKKNLSPELSEKMIKRYGKWK
jgi:hypothetical protein